MGIVAEQVFQPLGKGVLPNRAVQIAIEVWLARGRRCQGISNLVKSSGRQRHLRQGGQDRELHLVDPSRCGGIKARWTVLHGKQPVTGKFSSGNKVGMGKGFGCEALDRVAVECGDMGVHGLWLP